MRIDDERSYMRARGRLAALDREQLDLLRGPAGCLTQFLIAEADLREVDRRRDALLAALAAYDRRAQADRKGAWFPLHSGHRFWPQDPRPGDVHLEDVAHALARINRFNGHTKSCYSVAQHSVLGSRVVHPTCARFFLMHDAAEAYLGDLITPVKTLFREFFEGLEEGVMAAVADHFGFTRTPLQAAEVKRVDRVLLATEIRDLTTTGAYNGTLPEPPLAGPIADCWGPQLAELNFTSRFRELWPS